MIMVASGYAVLDETSRILVNTVSETARGAKVNWLHTKGGLNVLDRWPDQMIDEFFERMRGNSELVDVVIRMRRH